MITLRIRSVALIAALMALHVNSGAGAEEGKAGISARDLATLRDMSGLSISPDGQWAAFEIIQADPERNRYDTAWHVIAIETRSARRLADAGELMRSVFFGRVIEHVPSPPPAWSPDSTWIAYLKRERDRTQVWRVRRDGRDAEQLTSNEADVRTVVYAQDGRRLLFEAEPSQAQIDTDLAMEGLVGFRYDERFEPFYGRVPVLPRDADFRVRSVGRSHSQSQISTRQIWAYDLSNGRERLATEAERAEFTALRAPRRPEHRPAFRTHSAESPNGALAWTEARNPQQQGGYPPLTILAQRVGEHEPSVCDAAACTAQFIAGLWWRGDHEVIFVRREAQDRALYSWRPNESDAPRLILRTPHLFGAEPSGLHCGLAQDLLVCEYEQPDYPRRLVAIDLDGGGVETLYDPNPDFAHFAVGSPPQRLNINVDGESRVDTYGYLVLPPPGRSAGRVPLVIVTYQCRGFLRGGSGDEYPIYPLAAAGFAVLCFSEPRDLDRLARLDGGSYNSWDRGPGYPARRRVEAALDAAVTQLDEMGLIDLDRVGITGLSYGSEIVGFALPYMPRLAAAIASASPGPCAENYSLRARAVREWNRANGVGAPNETPERWRDIDFCQRVDRMRAPLLINAPDTEMLGALAPITALEQAGRAVEMFVFPDEHHVKWQPAHRLAIYNRNIDWMNFWLRGVEDPAPAKAEQYERWRAMRAKQCELLKRDDAPWYCVEK